jgi:hypothetical protein
MSTVIQSQIFEDISSSVERKALHPEFNFSPSLPPEYGGHLDFISRDVLQRESENDEELQRHLIAGNVPTVDTIYRSVQFRMIIYIHEQQLLTATFL